MDNKILVNVLFWPFLLWILEEQNKSWTINSFVVKSLWSHPCLASHCLFDSTYWLNNNQRIYVFPIWFWFIFIQSKTEERRRADIIIPIFFQSITNIIHAFVLTTQRNQNHAAYVVSVIAECDFLCVPRTCGEGEHSRQQKRGVFCQIHFFFLDWYNRSEASVRAERIEKHHRKMCVFCFSYQF